MPLGAALFKETMLLNPGKQVQAYSFLQIHQIHHGFPGSFTTASTPTKSFFWCAFPGVCYHSIDTVNINSEKTVQALQIHQF